MPELRGAVIRSTVLCVAKWLWVANPRSVSNPALCRIQPRRRLADPYELHLARRKAPAPPGGA
jgi:hypothetical protein